MFAPRSTGEGRGRARERGLEGRGERGLEGRGEREEGRGKRGERRAGPRGFTGERSRRKEREEGRGERAERGDSGRGERGESGLYPMQAPSSHDAMHASYIPTTRRQACTQWLPMNSQRQRRSPLSAGLPLLPLPLSPLLSPIHSTSN